MSKKIFFITLVLALVITLGLMYLKTRETLAVYSEPGEPEIIINEVMSSNTSTLIDFEGDTPDWIELENLGDAAVNLEGYALSDDPSDPGKWIFPPVEIPPNGFLVVFASGKNTITHNQVHTNFKISSKGENIILSDPYGNCIQQVEIPECGDNVSFGRSCDNPGAWDTFQHPSPGFPNSDEGAGAFEESMLTEYSPICISEVMAENISLLQDEDGDYPDWIEIYNRSVSDVDLSDYFLSDNENDLFQWQFPEKTIKPGEYLVVFCSGKNRRNPDGNLHTNFKINKSRETVLLTEHSGKICDSVVIHNLPDDSSYARETPDTWVETNKPTPGYPNTEEGYKLFSEAKYSSNTFFICEAMSRNETTLSDEDGNFNDWIEIKNITGKVQDLGGYALSDNSNNISKWIFPSFPVQPGESVIVFLSPDYTGKKGSVFLHANFGLNGKGDVLYFSDTEGNIIQRMDIPELTSDISYGFPDGGYEPFLFSNPTPGMPNDEKSLAAAYCLSPVFSEQGGFYTSPLSLSINSPEDGTIIYYTTDGSIPGPGSNVYTKPINIESTSVIRARAYKEGYLPSQVVTSTYFFEPMNGFATISITTDPENLWDEDTGIYVMGKHAESEYPYKGANFWQDWEKPAHIEFYEADGSLAFSMDAGISIHGGYTRGADQKSFAIEARKKYGDEYINYRVFPEKSLTKYQSIILRNSGQDNGNTKIRDVLISQLMKETGIDYQAYRPAVLYLNGDYWGLYTLRESTDKYFLSFNNHLPNPDNLDIIEGNNIVHQGDYSQYKSVLEYIKNHDLSIDEYYEHVKTLIDVDNFIDYQIAVIYAANTDNGNIKFWRERTPDSKWRWILFDFDMAFRRVDHDTVSHVFNPEGTGEGNWFSTTIQMGLLQNDEFKEKFLRRFAYHLNNTFETSHVISVIDKLASEIEPEIRRNFKKWTGSYSLWKECVQKLKDFVIGRPYYVKMYIQQYFGLTDEQMREYGF